MDRLENKGRRNLPAILLGFLCFGFIGKPLKAKPSGVMERLPHSFDARDWAKGFVETVRDHPGIPLDEATMTTWFATALMRGHDEAAHRHDAEVRESGLAKIECLQKESLAGAVARGWCADVNAHKAMDPDLAYAIVGELMKL